MLFTALCLLPVQVWFRKGLSRANGRENAVTGSKWVEMVGKFSLITVGLNDQVSTLSTTIAMQQHGGMENENAAINFKQPGRRR